MGMFESIVKALIQVLRGGNKPAKQDQPSSNAGGYPGAQQPSYPNASYPPPGQYQPPGQQQPAPHRPPQHQQYSPPPPNNAGGRPPRPIGQRVDENQVNQHNEHYLDLRRRANLAGDAMGHAFDESKQAYQNGDGARAKQLSDEGKRHKAEMEDLNRQASDWIYYQNNTDSGPNEVDLHGLYVKEAMERTEQAIQAAQQRGDSNVHLIVGKGLHSQAHVAKIKPAIEELMVKYQLAAQLDPHNAGVLIVQLNGAQRGQNGMGVDEISRRVEDNQCIIM